MLSIYLQHLKLLFAGFVDKYPMFNQFFRFAISFFIYFYVTDYLMIFSRNG